MTRPSDDDELLARIQEAVGGTAPERAALLRVGRKAFAARVRESGRLLARLTYDSLVEEPATVRGPAYRRVITFDAPTLSVEIEILGDRLLGQLVPPAAMEVEVRTPDGVVARPVADARGLFRMAAPEPGPLSFGCRTADGLVVTEWVRL